MADPIIAPLALAGFQAYAGLQQSDMIASQAQTMDLIYRLNQEVAEINAYEVTKDGISAAGRYNAVVKNVRAQQNAAYAASNVDASYGTAAEVRADTEVQAVVNVNQIKNNAVSAALGIKREAISAGLNNRVQQIGSRARQASSQNAAFMTGISTAMAGYMRNYRPSLSENTGTEMSFAGATADPFNY